jgi:hypothetical protein
MQAIHSSVQSSSANKSANSPTRVVSYSRIGGAGNVLGDHNKEFAE